MVQPCLERDGEVQKGHPVGFAAVCKEDLLNLKRNMGEAGVIVAYQAIKLIVSDIGIVTDIDTLDDLNHAETLLQSRYNHG